MTERSRRDPARAALSAVAGATLLEAVVALALGALAVNLSLLTVERTRDAYRGVVERVDGLEALRIARHVARRELRFGRHVRDWSASEDSIPLRAFRATALVCPGVAPSAELVTLYRGDRAPEPDKDSLLLIRPEGPPLVVAVRGVDASGRACAAAARAGIVLRVDREVPGDVTVARLFERGSYHLSGGALRYRRGRSGRQPLTPEVWSEGGTRWTDSGSRVGFELARRGRGGAERRWAGFLAWRPAP